MKTLITGSEWIRIEDDRIQLKAIARYQVAANELKIYLLSGEIFRMPLESEQEKRHILNVILITYYLKLIT